MFFGLAMVASLFGCNKENGELDKTMTAQVVGYDLNCSTCIVAFVEDSLTAHKQLGESTDNYYQTVNLPQSSYQIGQLIHIKVRRALDSEIPNCVALYPSANYQQINILDCKAFTRQVLGKTVEIDYKKCLWASDIPWKVCFDSIVGDSRCPDGAMCVWAGDGCVRLILEKGHHDRKYATLHTNPSFATDTVIDGFNIELKDLKPYPALNTMLHKSDYVAEVVITKNE